MAGLCLSPKNKYHRGQCLLEACLPRVELVPSHFSTSHSILAQVRSPLISHPSGWAWGKQVQEGLSGPLLPSTPVQFLGFLFVFVFPPQTITTTTGSDRKVKSINIYRPISTSTSPIGKEGQGIMGVKRKGGGQWPDQRPSLSFPVRKGASPPDRKYLPACLHMLH